MDRRSLIFVVALTAVLFFVNQWFSKSTPTPSTPPVSPKQHAVAQEQIEKEMETKAQAGVPKFSNEEFFVLENAYQQVVFSNLGGAIAEINLPFQSEENTKSFVRPINIDRAFKERYKANDHFPSFPYYINQGDGVKKIEELSLGGYYPLLRRTLFNPRDTQATRSPIKQYALKVMSDNEDAERKIYHLKRLEKDLIEFELVESDRKITKLFSLPKNPDEAPYVIEATIKVDGNGRGLWVTSGVPEVELISDSPAPSLTYRYTKSNNKGAVESLSLPKECSVSTSIYPDWVCTGNGFFALILDPLNKIPHAFPSSILSTLLSLQKNIPATTSNFLCAPRRPPSATTQGRSKGTSSRESMRRLPILQRATTPITSQRSVSTAGLPLSLNPLPSSCLC